MFMAKNAVEKVSPYSFMGLMASKGSIPGVSGDVDDKLFLLPTLEEGAQELVLDLTAKGDFFSLMTANGLMRADAPRKPFRFKIVRPVSLGGGMGGSFGGGAFAH